MKGGPLLELLGASLVKGGRTVLHDVSLTVRRGEHLAVVGPNGSGKSSLIHLLTRRHYPLHRSGRPPPVRIFGRDSWEVVDLRKRLGIVSPDVGQRFANGTDTGRLPALDMVLSGFFASEILFFHHDLTDAMRGAAREALARFGVEHLAARRIDEMSTGEARRVLLARAMVHGPPVLVLDEPTAGLDLVAHAALLADLSRLAREGTTIVLITHHVEEIIPEVQRVVLLRDGRVAFAGRKEDVLTSERLTEVFGLPVDLAHREGEYRLRIGRRPARDQEPSRPLGDRAPRASPPSALSYD